MKRALLLFALVTFSISAFAQKKTEVSGVVRDSVSGKPLELATISLMKRTDSTLITFTLTDTAGRFTLQNFPEGDYRLLITHLSYQNKNYHLHFDEQHLLHDLGAIRMNIHSTLLSDVTVEQEAPPVTLKNDTIEYNAGSFRTPPNGVVEDLLKKLPGVQIDKNGNITANGQQVNHVYVDGKEFFGNDPKIATKNLPADAIDKVQVFDKQSDISQLSGFDDGDSEKAINLQLKKDHKKGLFGKITGGYGTDDRYNGQFNINDFSGARQISALGMANNTNSQGFNFMDILNFTGGLKNMQQGGELNININQNSPLAASGLGDNNNAVNTVWAGGVNYNNMLGKKLDFNGNYFYDRYSPLVESYTQRQYFLPDSSYYYNQSSKTNNKNDNHRFNATATWQIDSMHSLKFTPSLTLQNSSATSSNDYQTLTQNSMLANSGNSNILSSANGYNFSNDILYKEKFNRKGRSFLFDLHNAFSNNSNSTNLQSLNDFFDGEENLIRSDSINQQSETGSRSMNYSLRAIYTEPLLKHSLMEFTTQYSNTYSTSEKITDDFDPLTGEYDIQNPFLTNDFNNHYNFDNAGLRFRTALKKINYSFGAFIQRAYLSGTTTGQEIDSTIQKTFVNILPNARFQYNFNQYRNLILQYTTSTSPPSISQLQPVPDNSNPLKVTIGNPNLKQQYSNNVMLHFLSSNPFKGQNLFALVRFTETQNEIVNYDLTDSLGITHTLPVNANGIYNLSGNVSENFPLHFMKSTFEVTADLGGGRNKGYINGVENSIHSLNATPGARLFFDPTQKIEIDLSASVEYNQSNYSLQPSLNTKYSTQHYETEFDWNLPANIYFTTDFDYTVTTDRAVGFNQQVPLWNASISKLFLKYHRGQIKLSAFDLLNRNVGITRTSDQNYIEDVSAKTVTQYFMLGFTYSLNKMSAATPMRNDGNMRIIRK